MWMTVFNALEKADTFSEGSGAPAHCPHPSECLRLPLKESRSFSDRGSVERLLLDRYRLLMAQQCACHGAGCC